VNEKVENLRLGVSKIQQQSLILSQATFGINQQTSTISKEKSTPADSPKSGNEDFVLKPKEFSLNLKHCESMGSSHWEKNKPDTSQFSRPKLAQSIFVSEKIIHKEKEQEKNVPENSPQDEDKSQEVKLNFSGQVKIENENENEKESLKSKAQEN
jgi:hypothetical protein